MKGRILVLDDNQDILDMVQEVLAYEGYETLCADSCRVFFEQVANWKPNLVLMDYRLIDGDGCELCKTMKTGPETAHIPVIIFSAYNSPERDLSRCGCDAVINKPFDLPDFVKIIEDVLTEKEV